MLDRKKNGIAVLKFTGYSLVGLLVFFARIRVGNENLIPIDYLIARLRSILQGIYGEILLVVSVCRLLPYFFPGRERKKGGNKRVSFLLALSGAAICVMVMTGIGPEALLETGRKAISATGNILCAIFLSSLFVPFLVEYGLVDAAGVFCRPFMKKLFHTPGSSAVIGVSAFLGNYSVGHIVSKKMYDEGKFTEREAIIVALGFSTCSIGLMLNLASYLEIMEYWNGYVLCVFLITFFVTALVARIPPISRRQDRYKEDDLFHEEAKADGHIFSRALQTGIDKAAKAPGIGRALRDILCRVWPVIMEITPASIVTMVCGLSLAAHSRIFYYLVCPLQPILKMAGLSIRECYDVLSGIGIGLMEPVLCGVVNGTAELSLRARWICAVVPYSSIIFFAGFIPSIRSCGLPCKMWELLAVWAERVILSTILAAAAAALLL